MDIEKNGLKDLIFSLCSQMSVSGFEERATGALEKIAEDGFDEIIGDKVGNHLLVKRCGREDAPKILIDAHFDEIGMMVTEICEGGFLRVCSLGGIDIAILQASEVIIYGKERIRGVVCSVPPHLKSGGESELPLISEILIDTGYSKSELDEMVSVGTPIGFAEGFGELLGDRIIGRSFDNKACGAAAIMAIRDVPSERLAGDVYLLLSSYEETSRLGGASAAAFGILPDYAMVVDVNLARVPSTEKSETVEMGKGVSISVSAGASVPLARRTQALCESREIAHTMIAAPETTGTNAQSVAFAADGIPCVDVGLPLMNMHTYSEIVSLDDAISLCRLIGEFVCDREIAREFSRERETEWKIVK